MIVLSGALVLVALVLLVFGALDRNLPFVYASIGVSVLSLLLLVVGILQRRGELGEDEHSATTPVTDTSAERAAALVGAGQRQDRAGQADGDTVPVERPAPAPVPVEQPAEPASRRVVPDGADDLHEQAAAEDGAVEHEDDGHEDDGHEDDGHEDDGHEDDGHEHLEEEDFDEEDVDEEEDVEDDGSGVTVLVVSGRPRYHLEGCRVLRGKDPEALDRDDARHHGFTPCGVCKPDADETAVGDQSGAAAARTTEDDRSFAEALFGEPLRADPSPAGGDSGALPDRPVQPVLPEVEPAAPVDDGSRPADLRGEDPADDPALAVRDDLTAEPSPDVAADPDELFEAARPDDSEPDDDDSEPDDSQPDGEAAAEPPDLGDAATAEGATGAPVAEEPLSPEPVGEPVAAEDVPVAGALSPVEVADPVPARAARRASRRTPAERSSRAASETAETAGAAPPAKAPGSGAARQPAAPTTPAKKGSAKRKAPAKAARAKGAAETPAAPAAQPQVKRPLVRTVRPDALRPGAASAGVTTTRVSARGAAPATGGSVVVVPDRDRFHRPDCRFVRDVAGTSTMAKTSATRQGYAACGVCKP